MLVPAPLNGGLFVPIVSIDMFEGRTIEQKRALVKKVTEAISETLGVSGEHVHIVLREMKRENYAEGGVPFSDK